MEKEGSRSGTSDKGGKRKTAASSQEESGDPPARVVRVEDLQTLVEGIVEKALATRMTTGSPPNDGGGKCQQRPSGFLFLFFFARVSLPGDELLLG